MSLKIQKLGMNKRSLWSLVLVSDLDEVKFILEKLRRLMQNEGFGMLIWDQFFHEQMPR